MFAQAQMFACVGVSEIHSKNWCDAFRRLQEFRHGKNHLMTQPIHISVWLLRPPRWLMSKQAGQLAGWTTGSTAGWTSWRAGWTLVKWTAGIRSPPRRSMETRIIFFFFFFFLSFCLFEKHSGARERRPLRISRKATEKEAAAPNVLAKLKRPARFECYSTVTRNHINTNHMVFVPWKKVLLAWNTNHLVFGICLFQIYLEKCSFIVRYHCDTRKNVP